MTLEFLAIDNATIREAIIEAYGRNVGVDLTFKSGMKDCNIEISVQAGPHAGISLAAALILSGILKRGSTNSRAAPQDRRQLVDCLDAWKRASALFMTTRVARNQLREPQVRQRIREILDSENGLVMRFIDEFTDYHLTRENSTVLSTLVEPILPKVRMIPTARRVRFFVMRFRVMTCVSAVGLMAAFFFEARPWITILIASITVIFAALHTRETTGDPDNPDSNHDGMPEPR